MNSLKARTNPPRKISPLEVKDNLLFTIYYTINANIPPSSF